MSTALVAVARADEVAAPAQADHPIASAVKLIAGGAIALAAHESGHLVFDTLFDAQPAITHVSYGPFPFFAISHRQGLSPRREFTIDAAGFWVQEGTNEWLLSRRPSLRHERAAIAKGVFAFNVLLSVGYAATAFARTGPSERDTRGVAASVGVPEPVVGLVLLAPAVLDVYRYYRPEKAWARWMSRVLKVGTVVAIAK